MDYSSRLTSWYKIDSDDFFLVLGKGLVREKRTKMTAVMGPFSDSTDFNNYYFNYQ